MSIGTTNVDVAVPTDQLGPFYVHLGGLFQSDGPAQADDAPLQSDGTPPTEAPIYQDARTGDEGVRQLE